MMSLWFLMASVVILTAGQASDARETVEIAEVHQINRKRHAESPDEMPESLVLRLRRQHGDVTLLLTRRDPIPEFPARNDVTRSRDRRSVLKDAAVYADERNDGHFIVRRDDDRYLVKGSFLQGDDEFFLEPAKRELDNNKHLVTTYIGSPARRSVDNRISRKKRAAKNHVVEIFFISDYSVYAKANTLFRKTGSLLTAELQLWYTFIANMVARVYKNIEDPDLKIQIKVKGIRIDTSPSQSPWTETLVQNKKVKDDQASDKFQDWLSSQNDLPSVDHVIGFTAYDLVDPQGSSTPLGLAPFKKFCDSRESNSVIEDDFTATTAGTVAHELAHNFGADHDESTSCSGDAYYMMSSHFEFPKTSQQATRPWRFSSCSLNDMKTFMNTVSCSLTETAAGQEVSSSQKAGQHLGADRQCQLKMGPSTGVCRGEYGAGGTLQYEDVCRELRCCGSNTAIISLQPLDFTQCGHHKWCVQGVCTSSPEAPAEQSPNCPFGDVNFAGCDASECSYQDASYRRECCKTCAASNTG